MNKLLILIIALIMGTTSAFAASIDAATALLNAVISDEEWDKLQEEKFDLTLKNMRQSHPKDKQCADAMKVELKQLVMSASNAKLAKPILAEAVAKQHTEEAIIEAHGLLAKGNSKVAESLVFEKTNFKLDPHDIDPQYQNKLDELIARTMAPCRK